MALIQETTNITNQATVSVLQRSAGESYNPWGIICLEIDSNGHFMTPKELRELGRAMIRESKRIGKEYTANGSIKQSDI